MFWKEILAESQTHKKPLEEPGSSTVLDVNRGKTETTTCYHVPRAAMAVPVYPKHPLLPDEKLSSPSELTQCFFSKNYWPMELHNVHCVRRKTTSSPAPVPCQFSVTGTSGSTTTRDHQKDSQDRRTHAQRGGKIHQWFQGNYYHILALSELPCTQNAWLWEKLFPPCIWKNKECLLLNATPVLRTFLFYQIFGNITATPRLPEQQKVRTKAARKVPPHLPPQISEASLQVQTSARCKAELPTSVFIRFKLGHLSLLPQTELLQTFQL